MSPSHSVDSPIPVALLRSPRIVRRKPGTLAPLLLGRILTAPVLALGALVLGLVVLDPIVVFLLPAQPARLIGRWCNKGHRGTACYIEYQFNRSGFIGRDEVLPDEYQAFRVEQPIKAHLIHLGPLGYSALDRSVAAYARYRKILWFSTTFAMAINGILFYALWLSPWRSHWLTRNGQATFGAIIAKTIIHGGRRHHHFTLTYQFKAQSVLRLRQIRISAERFDSAELNDLVVVLFDPGLPDRSIVYDYGDFIATG
jgi:hypothetical protein